MKTYIKEALSCLKAKLAENFGAGTELFLFGSAAREVKEGTGRERYIKKHEGHIEVESEEGKGTLVTLYLPVFEASLA